MSDSNIEMRIYNVEVALVGLATMIEDTLPPAYADDVNRMLSDFFDAAKELGGFDEAHNVNGVFKLPEPPQSS